MADLLIDTHVLIWMATGDPRLKRVDQKLLNDPDNSLVLSVVIAFEFSDLQQRGRHAVTESIEFLQQHMGFRIDDLPAEAWRAAASLPDIHRDPVDRMLIAHALARDMILMTADATIRGYPVRCA